MVELVGTLLIHPLPERERGDDGDGKKRCRHPCRHPLTGELPMAYPKVTTVTAAFASANNEIGNRDVDDHVGCRRSHAVYIVVYIR